MTNDNNNNKAYPHFLLLFQNKWKYYISLLLNSVAGEKTQEMSLKFHSLQPMHK